MKIGIYGGTFDPPHLGHMAAAKASIEQLSLDRLLLIPNRLPPHKILPKDSAKAEERFQMVSLMADGIGPRAKAADLELKRDGPSYMVDTVAQLRKENPGATFYLLLGTDMFLHFDSWWKAEELAKHVILAPFLREKGNSLETFSGKKASLEKNLGAKVTLLSLPDVCPVSSTEIRALLSKGETQREAGALLWCQVYGYILCHKLYGTQKDLKKLTLPEIRAVSDSMIRAKRISHIRGTEETAAMLAKHWDLDQEKLRRAAILHDCTKYWNLNEQLALCKKYGILLDGLERESVKLLHAKTAAALAQHVFGETEEVCRAIAAHTTGKPDMTAFDKVLYLSDYTEPNRTFEGVEELRQVSLKDLDAAMILGIEHTIKELNEKDSPVHPNAVKTLVQLRGLDL